MTTWQLPVQQMAADDDMNISQATPLSLAKAPIKDAANPDKPDNQKAVAFEVNDMLIEMFLGATSGSLGETSALMWLVGGIFLLVRRTITWHIPFAVLGSAGLIGWIAWHNNPEVYANPMVHLCGGGMMMCAFFIATDPVTCPLSKLGRLIFGAGVGSLIMLIRLQGGYPEGVMYAILLMNSMTPLLDHWTRPTPMGGHVRAD
jgi:H+/Na+-translocating ferredoxin:NAD+ oxidoreductase subunit D